MIYYRIVAIALALIVAKAAASTDAPFEPCPSPSAEAVQGDACLPFLLGSCPFGQVCCGDECYEERICYCDENSFTLQCGPNRISCPSACPATIPVEDELCDISANFDCQYGSGTCRNYFNETIDYDITCTCQSGTFTCEQGCPSYGSGPTRPSDATNISGEQGNVTKKLTKAKKAKRASKKQKKKKKNTRRLGATRSQNAP